MLTQRKKTKNLFFNHLIVLDTEGFKCGKKPLIIKELSVCSANTIDTIHFLSSIQQFIRRREKSLQLGI